MDMLAKYLFFVRMDVDPDKEERFNEWYNKEHIPALLKVPGVLSASRYVSLEGTPKYTAIYELNSPDVLTSESWKEAVKMTPRPKDTVSKNATRVTCQCIYPNK
jgi:antibiotic biosynthesis monooxygenase (ABM) superfamily enzyme